MTDLDKLEALAKAATPGPWFQCGLPWFDAGSGVLAGSPDPHIGMMIVDTEAWDGEREEFAEHYDGEVASSDADAAFIAAANPATILDLIASARRDAEEIERLKTKLAVAIGERCDATGDGHRPMSQGKSYWFCTACGHTLTPKQLRQVEARARAAHTGEG